MHHECEDHTDTCEMCVIVKNFHSADIPDAHITISPFEYAHNDIELHYITPVTHIYKGFYSTAPPLH